MCLVLCVNVLYKEDEATAATFSSETGLLTASSRWIDGSRSKSRRRGDAELGKGMFDCRLGQKHILSSILGNFISCFVRMDVDVYMGGIRSMNST